MPVWLRDADGWPVRIAYADGKSVDAALAISDLRTRITVPDSRWRSPAPADAKIALSQPADLQSIRSLALANPEAVPAGIHAKAYLKSLGLWEALEGKVVPTLDVRAALAAVDGGHADAGIVYATDAAISKKVRVAVRVPREQGPAIVYTLAPLERSTKPATRALLRFLASQEAAQTYTRFGFIVLPAE